MTDYIYESEEDTKTEFVDDGKNQVVLVTYKSSKPSVRKYKMLRIFEKVVRMLESEERKPGGVRKKWEY